VKRLIPVNVTVWHQLLIKGKDIGTITKNMTLLPSLAILRKTTIKDDSQSINIIWNYQGFQHAFFLSGYPGEFLPYKDRKHLLMLLGIFGKVTITFTGNTSTCLHLGQTNSFQEQGKI
jgi:hypothetical protein